MLSAAEIKDRFFGMQIELKPVSELTPYAKNSRTHSRAQIKQIAQSMQEFGFTNPILVKESGDIIAGHGRVLAAKHIGLSEVPCIKLENLSPLQIQAYIIADNQLALQAGWDFDILGRELFELQSAGFDLDLVGFDPSELEKLIPEPARIYDEEIQDDIPEVKQEDVRVQEGDIWLLGQHRLMCGDATLEADVSKLMDGKSYHVLFTDPPYNVDYVGKTKDALKIKNDKMKEDDFREFLRKAFSNAFSHQVPGGSFYICHADTYGFDFRYALMCASYQLRQVLIWLKDSMVMGRQDYHWQHEPILYGWKAGASHRWYADRKQTTVWKFERPKRSVEHPTMKPVALIEYALKNSAKSKESVLDPFGGSGSTLIAAEKLGLNAFLLELDPFYCQTIIDRWESFTGQAAQRLG